MTFHYTVALRVSGALMAAVVLLGSAGAVGRAATVGATRSGVSSSHPSAAGDRAIARDAELRLGDLPHGWTTNARPSTRTLTGCPGLDAARAAVSARMNSPEFRTVRATAQSTTYVYARPGDAAHWFRRLTDAATRRCFGRRLRKSLTATVRAEGIRVAVTIRRLAVPPLGDERAGETISVRLSRSGATATADVDFVFARVDRAIGILFLGQVSVPFDPTLERELANTVTHRIAANLGRRL